jgi:hypothetical protein
MPFILSSDSHKSSSQSLIANNYGSVINIQSVTERYSAQNVLRKIQCMPRHVSSWTTASTVQDVPSNTYHDRWIGRRGPTAWPPFSPDLNPLDFYLWGT